MVVRRSNAQRSGDTRQRILNAAVACLIEDGYAATSIRAIEARAGVSRGALLHQYPNRSALLVDAIRHLADQQTADMRRVARQHGRASEIRNQPATSPAWLDDLWSTFCTPVFGAVLELWVASRTDSELRNTLRPHQQQLGRTLREIAIQSLGSPPPEFPEVFDMTLTYFRGLALTAVLSSAAHRDHLFRMWRRSVLGLVRSRLDGAGGGLRVT